MAIAPFRLAVLTDLHVGATRANRWHNRFLSDRPALTAAATVAAINAERPDIVVALGDLSDTASAHELALARRTLDELAAPWVVCQGNHDIDANGSRATWDRHFGDRAPVGVLPPDVLPLPEGVAAVVFECVFGEVAGQWRVSLAPAVVGAVVERLREVRPELLLVFCHVPLIRQSEHVRHFGGKNAGTVWEGEAALAALAATAGATLCCTGHQHFHHIAIAAGNPRWLHCTTASLAEFPAEFRVIEVADRSIAIRTVAGAAEIVAAAPAPVVTWPAGRPEDREVTWQW